MAAKMVMNPWLGLPRPLVNEKLAVPPVTPENLITPLRLPPAAAEGKPAFSMSGVRVSAEVSYGFPVYQMGGLVGVADAALGDQNSELLPGTGWPLEKPIAANKIGLPLLESICTEV